MVEINKEKVLDWYQGLNASHRVEIICSLLDHCLPFELRFLGSVIEHLGRKDFHILRDAENKANSLHSSDTPLDVSAILKLLSEGPAPTCTPMNPQMLNPVNQTGGHHGHSTSGSNESTARPSPTQRIVDKLKSQPGTVTENGITSSKPSTPGSSSSDGCNKEGDRSNHVEVKNEDESESRKELWLHDENQRRKLILYLSVMSATNHDSANLYFLLLSDVDELIENLDWLEELEELVQDEILLLYTIGSHHPAFNFEKRTFLASVLTRFKDCMIRYSKDYHRTVLHPYPFNPYNPYFPQQFVYYQPHLQPMQSSQSSSGVAAEGVRAPAAYFQYPGFPYVVPNVNSHPPNPQQQYQVHQFPGRVIGQTVPPPPTNIGSQPAGLPAVSEVSSTSSSGQPSSKSQLQSSQQPSQQPHSHQSSISTPTRTYSLASSVTAFQSQANSVDRDSEGSCENCASWESPETSPFESPPQSLTPTPVNSGVPVAGGFHPGTSAGYSIPLQNGFIPHTFNQNGGITNSTGSAPSTKILMNPHIHPSYQYSLPFTIPPQQITPSPNKPLFATNPLAKDIPKISGSGDNSLIFLPAQMPNPPRSRSFRGDVGLSTTSTQNREFPSLNSLECSLMPGMDDPIDVTCRPRKISCYNCGSNQHTGPECKEASMEEMTKMQYRLNFGDAKEGE